MSQHHSHAFERRHNRRGSNTVPSRSDRSIPAGDSADSALDAALRSVPLPEGLMTRLAVLACTVPEDAADAVDWLGC